MTAQLYGLVAAYASLGTHHRTGTAEDDRTREWFAGQLGRAGAEVAQAPYDFDRYVATSRLTAAGSEVPSVPLWYAGTGSVEEVPPVVRSVALRHGVEPEGLDDLLEEISGLDRPVVLVTEHPAGRLVAVNRAPRPPAGPLVALAAGAEAAAIREGPTRLTLDARLEPGSSATVVGTWGEGDGPPLVVTTPLSGWYSCAGERGTGIALAIDIAPRLAEIGPVAVVGTTGHEIGFLGLDRFLGCWVGERPAAVLHLGASVAAADPSGELAAMRVAFTSAADPGALARALEPAGVPVLPAEGSWPGEGELWRSLGAPVLSLTGAFDRFHTPDDVPEAATSPHLLERVRDALLAAAARLR